MSRISGSGIQTGLPPQSASSNASQAQQAPTVGAQMQQVLFGKPKPPVLDLSQYPHLQEQLDQIRQWKKKFAKLQGDDEDDYDICLTQGEIAMIDEEGMIFVGVEFLEAFGENPEVIAGVIAHEIGHRPKRWKKYKGRRELSEKEVHTLARHEETRADIVAGKGLAELGMSCEPLCRFLLSLESGPHPDYWPAKDRSKIISDAHAGRAYRRDARSKIFPDYERMKSIKGHLGDG